MTTNKEFENIVAVLRDHLHLTQKEVEGYLNGSLDRDRVRLIEEHIRNCHHCSREVDLIREILSDPEPGPTGLIDRLGVRKVLPLKRSRKTQFDRFWLGDSEYLLSPMVDHPEFLEVEGLYIDGLLDLRREDRNDPGSVPVALEAQGKSPVVASLSAFEAAGDFKDDDEDASGTSLGVVGAALSFFAPILPQAKPDLGMNKLRGLPGKVRRKKRPKPKLTLQCRAKRHEVELYHDPQSDEIFLKVRERKDA
jgi:hypothetical protein